VGILLRASLASTVGEHSTLSRLWLVPLVSILLRHLWLVPLVGILLRASLASTVGGHFT
jgi:hypothetical protein